MNNRTQIVLTAIGAGISGYVAYFIGLPPQLQTGILGDLIALAPPDWQPALASTSKTISTILGFYTSYIVATKPKA